MFRIYSSLNKKTLRFDRSVSFPMGNCCKFLRHPQMLVQPAICALGTHCFSDNSVHSEATLRQTCQPKTVRSCGMIGFTQLYRSEYTGPSSAMRRWLLIKFFPILLLSLTACRLPRGALAIWWRKVPANAMQPLGILHGYKDCCPCTLSCPPPPARHHHRVGLVSHRNLRCRCASERLLLCSYSAAFFFGISRCCTYLLNGTLFRVNQDESVVIHATDGTFGLGHNLLLRGPKYSSLAFLTNSFGFRGAQWFCDMSWLKSGRLIPSW